MLTSWIAARGLENSARSVLAKVQNKRGYLEEGLEQAERPLKYSAYQEGFYFWYRNYLLLYKSKPEGQGWNKQEEVSVTCLGRSPHILKDLLKECQDEYLSRFENKTTIYGHSGANWEKEKVKDVRPLSTVLLREAEKAPLIKDMSDFLQPETREWYSQRSIPYRRGYLFHGPPGTGKSSFSLSVAGELKMDIYVLSIPSVNDLSLKTLFNGLPDRCVVLLEDIDAVGSALSRELVAGGSKESSDEGQGVTLSGLLNVLDGVGSQESRVVIMTTNRKGDLDYALTRPGRVDLEVEFQLADREITTQIYRYMVKQPSNVSSGMEAAVDDRQSIDKQAIDFACKIPEGKFSPAQIMSYLTQHRDMPSAALDNVEAWMADVREKNEKTSATQAVISR
ncbi:hypothetical protein N7476_005112 [Penicillium atrosanguineum]|uniref:Mitochondrial chaperone bcs1 n=1 Tax=Penicillium atrosanguineum TaxID=1132637 RepID=A0A9W9PZ94_9EURO|nr:hypothetical protein N7476_005112 [Penicillium atrosanguineum]